MSRQCVLRESCQCPLFRSSSTNCCKYMKMLKKYFYYLIGLWLHSMKKFLGYLSTGQSMKKYLDNIFRFCMQKLLVESLINFFESDYAPNKWN